MVMVYMCVNQERQILGKVCKQKAIRIWSVLPLASGGPPCRIWCGSINMKVFLDFGKTGE